MRKISIIVLALLAAASAAAAGRAPQDRPAPAAQQGKAPDYERIGRFIYAFHRAGVSTERLTDPVLLRRAPPDLARRAGALAERFDQVVANRVTASDEELAATLREAESVGAAIAQWWKDQQVPAS